MALLCACIYYWTQNTFYLTNHGY